MVLYRKYGILFVSHPLDRAVEKIAVRDLADLRDRFGDVVVVVLRGDLDRFGAQILHGVVCAVLAEFQLVGLISHRVA